MKKTILRAIGLAVALSGPAVGMAIYRGDGLDAILGGIGFVAGVFLITFLLARLAVLATTALGLPNLAKRLDRPWREALGGKASEERVD